MLTQTRNAYGLTRAFMLTGDAAYLDLALSIVDPKFGGAGVRKEKLDSRASGEGIGTVLMEFD